MHCHISSCFLAKAQAHTLIIVKPVRSVDDFAEQYLVTGICLAGKSLITDYNIDKSGNMKCFVFFESGCFLLKFCKNTNDFSLQSSERNRF